MTYSAGFLAVGAMLAAVAAWRLYVARAYLFRPAMIFARKNNPSSLWVSVGLLSFAALVFIAGGMHALVQ
jgi:hypothetical protein